MKALNSKYSKKKNGHYIWRTVRDDKVRPGHTALDGEVRTWNDSPAPGDEHDCRCWAEFASDSDIEKEELPPPNREESKIPGTNIPDHGIPEQGYPGSQKYDPYNDDGRDRAVPPLPAKPPSPNIDPGMEIPYNPSDPQFLNPYRDA